MMSTECTCICCLPMYLTLEEQIVLPEKMLSARVTEKKYNPDSFHLAEFHTIS